MPQFGISPKVARTARHGKNGLQAGKVIAFVRPLCAMPGFLQHVVGDPGINRSIARRTVHHCAPLHVLLPTMHTAEQEAISAGMWHCRQQDFAAAVLQEPMIVPGAALLVSRRALLGSIVASTLRRDADADDKLAVLIGLVGERLALMRAVAESKWNSGAPVEDEAREERLIAGVVALAPPYGLDPRQAAEFFRAQIEAAKCVESALIARWAAARAAPFAAPADLQTVIRPQLDRLTPALLGALAAATPQLRQGGAEQIAAASQLDDPVMAVAVARALQPLLELVGARAVAPTTLHP